MNDTPIELKLSVPTYNASRFPDEVERGEKPEFGEPRVPVLIREADGVRIVLGCHDYQDLNFPDIQVERQPNGWVVFVHSLPGGDASGFVYLHDDGRCFVKPELGSRPEIMVLLDDGEDPPGFRQHRKE